MTVLLIAGSPTAPSRSAALLDAAALRLRRRGLEVQRLTVRELPAQALVHAQFDDAQLQRATDQVAAARAVVVATPVYKAAYSGLLKTFLDLLPQSALKGKTVLPLATGGSAHHMLALDYALRPVLGALGARHILPGVYASDAQVTLTPEGGWQLQVDIADRLAEAVDTLQAEAFPSTARSGFDPIHFSRVRCSV
ncbi:NADPH-dependent FMN reductase [Xenophilus arseniciresistens]|uniref:NADPH-dependent FMN reductase n=1 Tax=Xenophilus arseniciresistens TaxID=1283306 RepID=A0AAE3N629_9BURK|nr:NADPH-dependent FMN reductase [Xenophilus arseniciresistens]MDA7415921.1 NADPH-dependent FMN reductase [Xenophilus arseniciresistens]